MMLLMYAWFLVLALIVGAVPHLIWLLKDISQTKYQVSQFFTQFSEMNERYDLFKEVYFLAMFGITCCFMVILSNFYIFHLGLVLTNTTTLEHLEWEKEPEGKKPNLEKVDQI